MSFIGHEICDSSQNQIANFRNKAGKPTKSLLTEQSSSIEEDRIVREILRARSAM
jgi:hypothetical protein